MRKCLTIGTDLIVKGNQIMAKENERVIGLYPGCMDYQFDVKGHTKVKCKYGRKICVHNKGKCPALEEIR